MTVRLFKSRRKTHAIQVGSVAVGGDAPISIQSMTTSKTHDVDATVIQISELAIAGCDIIRVGVPQQKDVEALPAIVERSPVPVVADIHFQPQFVLRAIEAGCGGVRVNPGNIRNFSENAPKIIDAAKANQVSLRIGVNAGSL
ncbi:MAG: flavodoxin-dependent (E)-4-hydroxy-3-methylbut-2-enyl-diphosphate synthase, partial [Bifidobacteriaceae bacterium]|nr:flavodoxin-dependent (E)-4-hydroxy-3-methylbut-2-enyl-diphosphate synthase [Bifidobacteriaceae bacterium]